MNTMARFPDIGRLVPLLGSDKDGEVLAAVAAIKRTLKRAGCDFHDLNAVIEGGIKAQHHHRVGLVEADDNLARTQFCWANRSKLKPSEIEFLQSALRILAYDRDLTPNQARWLRAIFVACGGTT